MKVKIWCSQRTTLKGCDQSVSLLKAKITRKGRECRQIALRHFPLEFKSRVYATQLKDLQNLKERKCQAFEDIIAEKRQKLTLKYRERLEKKIKHDDSRMLRGAE